MHCDSEAFSNKMRSVTAAVAITFVLAACSPTGSSELSSAALSIQGHPLVVEVARTPAEQSQGLMGRDHLRVDAGMLFVFDGARPVCMWMKNTTIALSVAFLDDKGKIVNVTDMEPNSETMHCAAKPVHYALEVSKGWFEAHGASAGTPVLGISSAQPRVSRIGLPLVQTRKTGE